MSDKKAKSIATKTSPPSDSAVPDSIDKYRIVQKLGEGGMGEVYEAEQTEPIRRRVALKIIKWGNGHKTGCGAFRVRASSIGSDEQC